MERIYRLSNRLWGWIDDLLVGPVYQAGLDRAANRYRKQRALRHQEQRDIDTLMAGWRKNRSKSNG